MPRAQRVVHLGLDHPVEPGDDEFCGFGSKMRLSFECILQKTVIASEAWRSRAVRSVQAALDCFAFGSQ
jgi:hypothetical protein